MWLQNFNALFTTDYTGVSNTDSVALQVSSTALKGTVINNVAPIYNDTNAFDFFKLPETVLVSVNPSTMTASIQADLGYQGMNKFMLSMTTNLVMTFAKNCSGPGVGADSCEAEPNFAINYFNMSSGPYPFVQYNDTTVDGYKVSGYSYDQAVCLKPQAQNPLCTPWYSPFLVVDTISSNNWNFGAPSTAGVIGLGDNSAVWDILNVDSAEYTIEFTNSTSWEFADPDYKPAATDSYIYLGQNTFNGVGAAVDNITLTPAHNKAYMYETSEFGFGIWNSTESTQYFESIDNDQESLYGTYTNITKFTLDFRGIGLPTTSYYVFTNLLQIAVSGQANCARTQGGYCTLPKNCSSYASLWEYSFKMAFTGQDNVLVAPLASFAADQTVNSDDICVVYVEMLDETLADSRQVIIGNMFFQSFAAYEFNNTLTLLKGKNALSSTYLGADTYAQSTVDAFAITPTDMPTNTRSEIVGFPTFSAQMTGLPDDVYPYYTVDFSNSDTVVWSASCIQQVSKPYGPCADAPTNLVSMYTNVTQSVGTFIEKEFGGYLCSGQIYLDEIMIGNSARYMKVYVADLITENAWNYDLEGAYGILGYGGDSAFWNEYIDINAQAMYSVSLANYDLNGTNPNNTVSNITLGAFGDIDQYTGTSQNAVMPSLQLSTDVQVQDSYNMTQLGFGLVYQSNGADSSQYFANMSTAFNAKFSTNFQGMGLPTPVFATYTELFRNISSSTGHCRPNADGSCSLDEICSNYDYLEQYSFQIAFESEPSMHMNVPLATFAINEGGNCRI